MRKIDYESEYKRIVEKNIQEVRAHINDKDMQVKINNYCAKYGLPKKFVERKILTDNIFAISFAKDPGRQSFHQHYAAKFIKEIPGVIEFKELPASGPNALFILDGRIVKKEELRKDNDTKSIDFFWKVKAASGKIFKFYAAHKHTAMDGGSQDNQFNDLKLFMKQGSTNTNDEVFILAIGDGPYYQRNGRLHSMNVLYGGVKSQCMALTTNDIESLIKLIMTKY